MSQHLPENIGPMGSQDYLNSYRMRNESGSDIGGSSDFRIVELIEGTDGKGRRLEIRAAEPDNLSPAAILFVTKGSRIQDNKSGICRKSMRITGVNTSGSAVRDPVYLASGGGWSLTGSIVVGFVTKVGTTDGAIHLAPQYVRPDLGAPGLGQTKRMTFVHDVSAIATPGATETLFTVPNGQKWELTNLRLTTTEVMNGTGVTTGDIGWTGNTATIADASVIGHDATVGTYYNDTLSTGSGCWDNTNANAEDVEIDASGGAVDVDIILGTSPTTGKVVVTVDVTRTV